MGAAGPGAISGARARDNSSLCTHALPDATSSTSPNSDERKRNLGTNIIRTPGFRVCRERYRAAVADTNTFSLFASFLLRHCYPAQNLPAFVPDWKSRDFCIEIVTRGYSRDEPNEIERKISRLGWVLKALWAERTTHSDIAKDLSIPMKEVSALLFGVLSTSVSGNPHHNPSQLFESSK